MQVKDAFFWGRPPAATSLSRPSRFAFSVWWHHLAFGFILLLSAFLNFIRLDQLGFGNRFYAAGIRSMLDSWHNFFFVSFDPGGFVSIDKPPLGLWIQVLSVKLFGFSGLSMLMPEALAGVISVALLYHLVARTFGVRAGLLAALALAVSPLSVVISRNNTMDMLLVCTILLATWTILRATETGRFQWLCYTALLIGLAFNIKTLEAYLVVPTFGLLYLLGAPHRWRVRCLHLLLATGVLLVVSLSWITIVDLTPASERPYVGSTADNSELSLALGYNGFQRLLGTTTGLLSSPTPAKGASTPVTSAIGATNADKSFSAHASYGSADIQILSTIPQAPDIGETGETGHPGLFRLFGPQLSIQIAWLLPSALLGLLAASWQTRWRFPLTRQQQSIILWGGCLVTMGIFFSVADLFNIYYLVIIAPAICALAGIGIVAMWRDYRLHGWRAWLLPIALILAAGMQAFFLSNYPGFAPVLVPVIIEVCVLAAAILIVVHLLSRQAVHKAVYSRNMSSITGAHSWWEPLGRPMLLRGIATTAFLSLLIAPFVWGSYSVLSASGIQRAAGPQPQITIQAYFAAWQNAIHPTKRNSTPALSKLDRYLLVHRGQAFFIVAALNSDVAAPIILDTNQPVMTLGGFSGNDPILTTQQLVTLINRGTVRFFLLQVSGVKTNNDTLVQWVRDHCTKVLASEWATGKTTPDSAQSASGQELIDCTQHR